MRPAALLCQISRFDKLGNAVRVNLRIESPTRRYLDLPWPLP